ncbi:MAG: hypothetical protein KC729_20150, partial [Candidatus Eisenbacteria bacterium]|nr:hypothetical protein [Candidatus Eisenbacteria bacterium]
GPTEDVVELAVYSFGALSVTYSFPLQGELDDLVTTSDSLYDDEVLFNDARTRAQELLDTFGRTVTKPALSDIVEDYIIYHLRPGTVTPAQLLADHRSLTARILRAEQGLLSEHEIQNALSNTLAYGPDEVAIVDWLGAILLGADMEDEKNVLELANVELLELRFLDAKLEEGVDSAYDLLERSRRAWWAFALRSRELERLGRMQADSTILLEGSDNALKLVGEDYLARFYGQASDKLHFSGWEASIDRKLRILESIYSQLSDIAAHRRSELLEWIIVLLISVEIALYFLGR